MYKALNKTSNRIQFRYEREITAKSELTTPKNRPKISVDI